MHSSLRTGVSVFLAGFLLTMSQAGNAVTIAQMPLFISAGVTPNVMLVVDNSGSMDSIVWSEAFDSRTNYPDWSPRIDHDCNPGTALREAWSADDGSINRSTLVSSNYRGTCGGSTNTAPTCAAGLTRGRNTGGTVTKCLKLPNPPAGGSTRFLGNYLNYLFQTYASGTDLTGGQVPNETRMTVAKDVANDVVNNNSNLNLGLTRFNSTAGGQVVENCGASKTDLNNSINALTASTWTPLAETLYEVTRYFRGLKTQYNGSLVYTSPILYRCQKNFVIMITDGFPTQDESFPTTIRLISPTPAVRCRTGTISHQQHWPRTIQTSRSTRTVPRPGRYRTRAIPCIWTIWRSLPTTSICAPGLMRPARASTTVNLRSRTW